MLPTLAIALQAAAAVAPAAEVRRVKPPFQERFSRFGPPRSLHPPIGGYFPDKAERAAVGGSAVLRCTVGPDQRLAPCERVSAEPADDGFDFAALLMAKDGYARAPADVPPGEVVQVRFSFPKPR